MAVSDVVSGNDIQSLYKLAVVNFHCIGRNPFLGLSDSSIFQQCLELHLGQFPQISTRLYSRPLAFSGSAF